MRLDLFTNGMVDDLVIESVTLQLRRTGDARYLLEATGKSSVLLTLWTTRKDRVLVDPWPDRPAWAVLETGPAGELVFLRASDCDVHFENLDRSYYFLGLTRGPIAWGLNLRAHGYIH